MKEKRVYLADKDWCGKDDTRLRESELIRMASHKFYEMMSVLETV